MSNLIRMVYVSTTTRPVNKDSGGVQVDVGRILLQARKNNPARQIGGVLYFDNNYFFQCLEGEQQEVNQVFQKIMSDPRHTDIQTISVKHIQQRMFSNWSMKYVALEDRVRDFLSENGFAAFNPYQFNDAMIEKMLTLFVATRDKTALPDQSYDRQPVKQKSGFISRLLGRKAEAA